MHGEQILGKLQTVNPRWERERLDFIPQKAVPKVNHWIPDANANNLGVLDRTTPAKLPTKSPDKPVFNVSLRSN